jgi:hypothetical protein
MTTNVVRKPTLLLAGIFALALTACVSIEGFHYYKFRHLVGWGVHMDVALGNSDAGERDTYYARVWNVSLHSLSVEGCRLPGGYVGEGILYRWDVQKWDAATRQWNSLQGADNWMQGPFEGSKEDGLEGCNAESTRIGPFSTRVLGWVYKDWVTSGEPVRMAIHTSVSVPAMQQQILYTDTFVVRRAPGTTPSAPIRIK